MFTGIVRGIGVVKKKAGHHLEIQTPLRCSLGESVAVNGACLTVKNSRAGTLGFDVSAETLRLTNLSSSQQGDRVNVEPALRLGEELGGHLMSGHVDGQDQVLAVRPMSNNFVRMKLALPKHLRGLAALKGSISVDGVSLTIAALNKSSFEVELVPHTLKNTTLGERRPGDLVNLEADTVARYVQAALEHARD